MNIVHINAPVGKETMFDFILTKNLKKDTHTFAKCIKLELKITFPSFQKFFNFLKWSMVDLWCWANPDYHFTF